MKLEFNKNIISLIVAVILGIIAIVLVNVYMAKREKQKDEELSKRLGGQVSVVIATRDISRGTKISSKMVKASAARETALQPRAVSSLEGVVGKVAIADIISGEQITYTKLVSRASQLSRGTPGQGSVSSLAMKIPAGNRAFTISIDEISAAGGMIRPNDYVDIMGIFPFTQDVSGKVFTQNVSVTLFQNILVLAVGRDLASGVADVSAKGRSTGGGGSITFALTPQQVELLNFAKGLGKLQLILRPPLETTIHTIPPVSAETLWQHIISQADMQLPDSSGQVAPKDLEPSKTVEIYRGNQKVIEPLD